MSKVKETIVKVGAFLGGVLCLILIVAFIVFLIQGALEKGEKRQQEEYQAWCKYTDNPKKLTYKEYVLLNGTKGLDK